MLEKEKAVKMFAGLTESNNRDRFAVLGLETLQRRWDRQGMTIVHKYINRDEQSMFTMAEGGRCKDKESSRPKKHCEPIDKGRYSKQSSNGS